MSRVLDFRDLRERVLAGEEEEDLEPVEDTPLQIEAQESMTLVPFCLSVGTFGFLTYDHFQDNPIFSGSTRNMILIGLGVFPLGLALGRLNRGLNAQRINKNYEKLLDEADAKIEELEKEVEEAENESNSYHFDYLNADDSSHHVPSLGFGVSAFGQEGVIFRPPVTESLW